MIAVIFWCEWDEKQTDSHELLRLALEQYLGHGPIALAEKKKQEITDAGQAGYSRQENTNTAQSCLEQKSIFGIGSYQEEKTRCFLSKKDKGKPYFENFAQVKFSISHSENFWACAFSDAEVGLDLQSEYRKDGEKLARRFFHPEEIAWMEKNGFRQFSRIWTHKESFVKFTGMGLTQGMDYFSVAPWLGENGKNACGEEIPICQQEIPFREDYWMVLTSGEVCEVEIRQLSIV